MSQTIHDILEPFREEAFHNRRLGDKFERLKLDNTNFESLG
jgi:hypothetical protein